MKDLSKKELTKMAKKLNIKNYSRLSKTDLIKAIEKNNLNSAKEAKTEVQPVKKEKVKQTILPVTASKLKVERTEEKIKDFRKKSKEEFKNDKDVYIFSEGFQEKVSLAFL